MKAKVMALLLASGLSALAPAIAPAQGGADERAATVAALEHRSKEISVAMTGKLGAIERDQLYAQRKQIRNLIARLSAGEKVRPEEVDRALGH